MKGENFYSELPIGWRLAFLGAVVLIAVAWYLYCRRQARLEAEAETPVQPETALSEKKVVTIYDYDADCLEAHRFVSPVDSRLTVREVAYKNHDILTLATSWPHVFTNEQLIKIQKMFLEITKLSVESHDITVTKSPAASFSDFKSKLIGEIFAQLHRQYALRLFRQHFKIKKDGNRVLDLNFDQGYDYLDDFCERLRGRQSISHIIVHDNIKDCKIVLIKDDDRSWWELKKDVLAVAADYFPAGVDWEGEWPGYSSLEPGMVKVDIVFNAKREIILTFWDIHLQERIKDLMKEGFWGIDSAHVHYVFDPKKSVVTLVLCPEIDFFRPFEVLPSVFEKYDDKQGFNVKVSHPEKTSENSQPALVSYQINAVGQLVFYLPFDFDSNLVKDELLFKVIEITDVDLGYEVHSAQETRVVISKRDNITWQELQFSILSVLVSIAPRTLLTKGEWPKDEVCAESVKNDYQNDCSGTGSINT
ncbi:MAG: hypothetical protein HY931_03080 [Candidatus Falkowbacteria bacterium]|nr:MAG: hypothetical protein HY931_03080 [Candidatus Falkowbacteria bacterium]